MHRMANPSCQHASVRLALPHVTSSCSLPASQEGHSRTAVYRSQYIRSRNELLASIGVPAAIDSRERNVNYQNLIDKRRLPYQVRGIATTALVFCGLLSALGCRPAAVVSRSHAGVQPGIESKSTPRPGTASPAILEQAEQAFANGETQLQTQDAKATASFFEATRLAWRVVCQTAVVGGPRHDRAGALYHDSLRGLIESAQHFDQLDPHSGLNLTTEEGPVQIPIQYHAFAWQPEDFNLWLPVGEYSDERMTRKHRRAGWGVPLVIVRQRATDERFMTRLLPFSATVLLRPATNASSGEEQPLESQVLQVFNPLAVKTLSRDDGSETPLAADISAPVAWLGENAPQLNFQAYLHPDRIRSSGQLIMLEPYQPGKIPVIFTHGLLSGPLTWSGLINELRASDWFNQRYQVWVFGYSTGRPFLHAAADMRRECQEAFTSLTRDAPDPALGRAVLIGHSMGGLLTKLQISHSDETLWKSFANRPLESLRTDHVAHQYLTNAFFFQPLPFVERAVFIGTPHGGSPIAEEWIGRFAARLVSRSNDLVDEYKTFMEKNRDVVDPFFVGHIPTSVEMLKPEDPVLQAMRRLRVEPRVRMHSVIGTGQTMLVGGPADGVVPVDSARHPGVDSELQVPATHRQLQSHPETVQEVLRILMLHLEESPEARLSRIGDLDEEAIRLALMR